jgi:hypothetical protein
MLVPVVVAIVTTAGCGLMGFSRRVLHRVEFQLREYSLAETQRNRRRIRCRGPAHPKRLRIPTPLVPGQPA